MRPTEVRATPINSAESRPIGTATRFLFFSLADRRKSRQATEKEITLLYKITFAAMDDVRLQNACDNKCLCIARTGIDGFICCSTKM